MEEEVPQAIGKPGVKISQGLRKPSSLTCLYQFKELTGKKML